MPAPYSGTTADMTIPYTLSQAPSPQGTKSTLMHYSTFAQCELQKGQLEIHPVTPCFCVPFCPDVARKARHDVQNPFACKLREHSRRARPSMQYGRCPDGGELLLCSTCHLAFPSPHVLRRRHLGDLGEGVGGQGGDD